MKVLIVEDNEINSKLLEITLDSLPFSVCIQTAATSTAALQAASSEGFDLVLMDINLGDGEMDGTEVMHKLRQENSNYVAVPFYAVTCYALPGDKERFLAEGFDNYFSKPIDTSALLSTITSLVSS